MSNSDLVRASRDGDYFHYLWAARRCLLLLAPGSDLVAVTIEGPSPDEIGESVNIDDGEELIDVGEYYGSQELAAANLVRYIQLKHSTNRTDEHWTASGLKKTIKGFADRYRAIKKALAPDTIEGRLELWFVSNRPISLVVKESIDDAALGRSPRHTAEAEKLSNFADLAGAELTEFCKLIRLAGDQAGYWDQRDILTQDVSGYLPDWDVDAPTQLKELVTRKALSESAGNPAITKMDVLRVLKTDEHSLLPAPRLIEVPKKHIEREQEAELLDAIVNSQNCPVIVHADGGVGKSIFTSRIGRGLPTGSYSIVYDCFGSGQYRNASGFRHRHRQALVQIANELAGAGLCHPLIPTQNADSTSYIRAFVYRLKQAVASLRSAQPSALLCIVVDAADNAQMAAIEIGETRSFIKELLREEMPDGVRLVALCRTHRVSLLDPPPHTIKLQLRPFVRSETAVHLKTRFPSASDYDIDEFHRLSSHNPRVQSLALNRYSSIAEMLRALGPAPTTVERAISDLLEKAIEKLRDESGVERAQIDSICESLAALRPLIPISVLSTMSGVDEGAIRSFASDLGRPLHVVGGTIQFMDEPTETWFREKYKPSYDALLNFIQRLRPLASTSAYVSSVMPQILLEAGQFDELVSLALSSSELPMGSSLERRDIQVQRLQFALKASLRTGRYRDAAKLALQAGGESAGDSRQRRLIQTNTDLSAIFLDVNRISDMVSRRSFSAGWTGSHHAYEAGLMSGRAELVVEATSRLRMASEWVQNWSKLSSEERRGEQIRDADIAEMALAVLNIRGPQKFSDYLRSWSPRQVSYRVGRIVARRLCDHGRYGDLDALAISAGNDVYLVLAVTEELRRLAKVPPKEAVERTLAIVGRWKVDLDENDWGGRDGALSAIAAVVEAGHVHRIMTSPQLASILTKYLPSNPPRGLASRYGGQRAPLLAAYCLRSALQNEPLELLDLAHQELRDQFQKSQKRNSDASDVQEFKEIVGALLPWHMLRARHLIGSVDVKALDAEISQAMATSDACAAIRYREEQFTSNEIALLWGSVVVEAGVNSSDAYSRLNEWINKLRRPPFTPTFLSLARMAALSSKTYGASLEFLSRANSLIKDEKMDAESKATHYIDAARAILTVSNLESAACFNEAIDVASKIGDENLDRWTSILDLADCAAKPSDPAPEAAYRLSRAAELTYAYVDRDKHFDWEATVSAISALCPASSISILSRWRDRCFGRSMRLFPNLVENLLNREALHAISGACLLPFRGDWSGLSVFRQALSSAPTEQDRSRVVERILPYVVFDRQSEEVVEEIRALLSSYGISNALIPERSYVVPRKEGVRSVEDEDELSEEAADKKRKSTDWDSIFADPQVYSSEALSSAFVRLHSGDPPFHHDKFFEEAFARTPAGKEANLVTALTNVPHFNLYHVRTFLECLPIGWKNSLAFKQALNGAMRTFCRRFCMGITRSRYYEVLPFKLACELSGIPEKDLFGVVLAAIGDAPELVGASRLFTLVGILATQMSKDDALEVLNFGLELYESSLEPSDADGPWRADLAPRGDVDAALGGYIWAALGSPKATMRWEAAHAVRSLFALGRVRVIESLLQRTEDRSAMPFTDASFHFYYYHAKQWLMIAIARSALESPQAVRGYVPFIARVITESEPHILIRHFALLALKALGEAGMTGVVNIDLLAANSSPFEPVLSKRYDRLADKKALARSEDNGREFWFGMDFDQYWLDPLGAHFAKTRQELRSDLMSVIRGHFNYDGDGSWDQDQRAKRDQFPDGESYHRHGDFPQSTSLGFYFSYHAMMVVAGKLLSSVPIHRDPDGYDEGFESWIARHALGRTDERWLFDRRDVAPAERPAWKEDAFVQNWHGAMSLSDLNRPIDFDGVFLNVWGYWSIVDGSREEVLSVRSALVPPGSSEALLSALQTAPDPEQHHLPTADDSVFRSDDDSSLFQIMGWISHREGCSGLDDDDPWAAGVKFPPPCLSPSFLNRLRLTSDADLRTFVHKSELAFRTQAWGQYVDRSGREHSVECGERIRASLNFVVDALRVVDRDLIIRSTIRRSLRSSRYESSKDDLGYVPESSRYFLVRKSGAVLSL